MSFSSKWPDSHFGEQEGGTFGLAQPSWVAAQPAAEWSEK